MHRPLLAVLLPMWFSITSPAQTADDDKAYARIPREIAFQNDSQWEDNRWQKTDTGPFLAGSIQTPKGLTLKGLAIRVGDDRQASICYDTARCRVSAAWKDGFLQFDPRRFGVIRHPASAGQLVFSTDRRAGWARDGDFQTDQGNQITRLPEDWISYRGYFTHNDRVILDYSVGGTRVLESPWYVETETSTGSASGFIRSLEIEACDRSMQMWIADAPANASIIDSTGDVDLQRDGRILNIGPHKSTLRVKLLITRDVDAVESLRSIAGGVDTLSDWAKQDNGRFPEILTTVGTTTESGGPYVIDTLTLPFENPWDALLFTAGHDFFSDGTAAICTLHGDVWTVSGIDRELKRLRWRRFATGLSQPLGLKIVDDQVYVINRTQLTRLHDRNGDGEADHYECFNNDNFTTPGSHDFVTCLETDATGNFYYIHARTGVMKVSPDGRTSESIADGFRNPNGMGVGPDGTVTAAPQQGQWTPQSSLIVVRDGGYYGYGGPRKTPERPTGWDLPMCFIPHTMDNSGGGQVWVESDRWGPLTGRMLHLSYGQCRILLAVEETVGERGIVQGGTIEFPTSPGDFESGIMRGRFNPHDGQLYVSGLRGWQTRAIRDGCFQRVRYTGGPVHLPSSVKTLQNGVLLSFSEPLDEATATDPDNFFVTQWNYLWSSAYGSPEFSVERPQEQGRDEVPVVSATLSPDRRSVFVEMTGLHPVNQMLIDYSLRSDDGQAVRGRYAHTINMEPTDRYPESQILRRRAQPLVTAEVMERLRPGLSAQYSSRSTGETDVRILRLAACRDQVDMPPTVFLPAGPFESEVTGTIKIPMSGDYEFRFEGTGVGSVLFPDHKPVPLSSEAKRDQTSVKTQTVRLRKGHNPITIRYASPTDGIAKWKLWWKGYNFGWEPVPPDVVFHDRESEGVRASIERRMGRRLVAQHRCVNCHRTELGDSPMMETTLEAPKLDDLAKRLNRDWIEHWLVDPASVHSDPSMPSLLNESAREEAAHIATFLTAMQLSESSRGPDGRDVRASDGEVLYEQWGCITCHHFEEIDTEDDVDRLSLHYVAAKYRPRAIAALLMDPDQHHTASKMPDFSPTREQAEALEEYVRSQSSGKIEPSRFEGRLAEGITAVATYGCQQCHALGSGSPMKSASRKWRLDSLDQGCLSDGRDPEKSAPSFAWTPEERVALRTFVSSSLESLSIDNPAEASARLVEALRCNACHDRDGVRSQRPLVIAEEGSGRLPEVIPSLTWLGEKFHADWNRRLLSGQLRDKPRPWLTARMPAFPAYAQNIATGLAVEHAVDPQEAVDHVFDEEIAKVGERLTLTSGLDCRQCHAIGDLKPRGDDKTQIALGINFQMIRDRMRYESYHRFMLDPPRYDINTKMIKLSEDGVTTKLKTVYDQDAKKQFDAVWEYMQSLDVTPSHRSADE